MELARGFICPYIYNLRNLGDLALNNWLLKRIIPEHYFTHHNPSYLLLGPGSILGYSRKFSKYGPGFHSIPRIVIGSGWQSKDKQMPNGSIVVFVRGEYTCRAMGIDASLACGDGALLSRKFLNVEPDPVFDEAIVRKHNYSGKSEKHLFTTNTDDFESWIEHLLQYRRISTDSLHAAIFADMFRIPWKPLRWKHKWADHFSMLGISEKPRTYSLSKEDKLCALEEKQHKLLTRFTASLESIRSLT